MHTDIDKVQFHFAKPLSRGLVLSMGHSCLLQEDSEKQGLSGKVLGMGFCFIVFCIFAL